MATRDEDLKDQESDAEELSVNEGVDELPEEDLKQDEENEAEEEETASPDDTSEKEVEEEEASPKHEHSLEDLAEEETPLPSGVTPQRPKSFNMEPSFNSNFPQSGVYTSRGGGGGKKGSLLALALIALLIIGGSIYLLKSRLNKTAASPEPTLSTELTTPAATPTPTPSLDRTKYKIRVLNGTSTSGLAASVSGKLKDLGYQIDKTGNASNSAFTKTVIQAKSGLAELIDALIKDLAPNFSASSGGTLKDADAADAEIILGTH